MSREEARGAVGHVEILPDTLKQTSHLHCGRSLCAKSSRKNLKWFSNFFFPLWYLVTFPFTEDELVWIIHPETETTDYKN